MSLWSDLSLGVTGLQASTNALNTVAHNITNADTEGYTRQQVELDDRRYITISKTGSAISYQQTGLGVYYSNAKQVRDYFLDKTYRTELGRQDFYEVSKNTLNEIEDLLGELNGASFQESLSDLWTAVQELTKDPCNSVTQGALVSEAAEFLERAKSVYSDLAGYQDNINYQVLQDVKTINAYGKQILELNSTIQKIELGQEKANDFRDQRNLILDKLSSLCNISYTEDQYGAVSVQIEGEDFVKGSLCYEIWIDIDSQTGFYTPYWPQNSNYTVVEGGDPKKTDDTIFTNDGKKGDRVYHIESAKVFDLSKKISSEAGTDVGKLRSLLYARGDHRADYTDVSNEERYNKVKDSVLMNVQAEFDQLLHNIMTGINGVLEDAAGVRTLSAPTAATQTTNPDAPDYYDPADLALYNELKAQDTKWYNGKEYKIYKDEDDGYNYLESADGSPLQLFEKNTTDGWSKADLASGSYWVFNEEEQPQYDDRGRVVDSLGRLVDPSSLAELKYSLYTITNTRINQNLLQTPSLLGFRLPDGSEDIKTMNALKNVFTDEKYRLNPDVIKRVNLNDYYSDLVSQVSNSGYMYNSIYENQAKTVSAAESAKDQVEAVSSDEELGNMIKHQSAYNASSRFINVVDEMMEHLITSLA
ncbi:MAG: flagellar hook-associated protein FlgK [Lachnospiraceae bacterium]|nr:flagellar hook-associated protein FlgK [Lachnospiraceae bacterium]